MKLRTRLSLIAAMLTFLGLAIGLTVIYLSVAGIRLSEIDAESRLLAEVILEAVTLRPEGTIGVPGVVESYLTDEDGASSAQVYLDGGLAWEGGVLNAPRPLDPEGLLDGRGVRSVAGWRVYTARAEDDAVIIQVGRPLASFTGTLSLYRSVAIPAALALALLASVSAWFVVGLALRPLRELADAATGFDTGGAIPDVPGRDEPAMLARSFAGLLSRLRSQRRREQEFLAYASHELRTPISALRAGLEAARSGRLPLTDETVGRLHGEALRMEQLAANLLALSRAEGGNARREWISLDEIASAAYDRFVPLALERGVELDLDSDPATVVADEQLLGRALDNLVINALRHGGVKVSIRAGCLEGVPFLEVRDRGRGLRDPVREGLGLRVARAVADAHDGSLQLTSADGLTARIWLGRPAPAD